MAANGAHTMIERLARVVERWAMNRLQRRISAWANVAVPSGNPNTITAHLYDEAVELHHEAAMNRQAEALVEAADVTMLALHLATKYDASLYDAIDTKFAIVQTRTYEQEPNERGYMRHTRDGAS